MKLELLELNERPVVAVVAAVAAVVAAAVAGAAVGVAGLTGELMGRPVAWSTWT